MLVCILLPCEMGVANHLMCYTVLSATEAINGAVYSVNILFPFCFEWFCVRRELHCFPTRRSSDLHENEELARQLAEAQVALQVQRAVADRSRGLEKLLRSEEHTSELQSRRDLVCRLLRVKKNSACLFASFFLARWELRTISCVTLSCLQLKRSMALFTQ